ncbi:hypothetical protein EV143_103349 [Flavobacterium chryseum]|uniref:hypothetical protein n=1 Tax=Flavobacterium sp. P3160 TaxID=2512113 RepID=UPI001061200A|nr:hypothetical protein [Flavobacterium sp. P3160]TDO78103.1 hypothetical protein EV143_103349 [Flavobacterium sp. P3160]
MSEQPISPISNSIVKKISACLLFGLEFSALFLLLGNGGNIPWLPPVFVFPVIGIALLASVLFPFIWHSLERKQKINSIKIYGFLYGAIRYCIAFNIMAFGWKKFYGLQFIVPSEIAQMPMNQQTGEWLTWFYFGYSHTFGIIIATIQIIGGFMLLFRQTVLAGAIILFSLLLNLTLINVFYDMNAGALMQSVLLTIGVLFLLLLDYKKLVDFFFKTKSDLPSLNINNKLLKNVLRFSALVLSLLFTIYLRAIMK